jgi:DNA-binding MarR family transcriptional regulator
MPSLPIAQLPVLHQLRLRGLATPAELGERLGQPEAQVADELEALAAAGLVRSSPATALAPEAAAGEQARAWTLTAAGRAAHQEALARQLDEAGGRPRAAELYERFRGLNADLLATCTAWQLRDVDGRAVVNDHLDPAHDAQVLSRLAELDDRAQVLLAELAATLPRLGSYGPRLAAARSRVEAGQREWFTKPLIDSYHTVWFELHEDLLATLGIERAGEPAA